MTPPTTVSDTSGVLDRPLPAPGRLPRGRSAVFALARVESVCLLRHPALLAATSLYAAFWISDLATGDDAHRFPVLQDESWFIHLPLLLVAAGVLLAANQGALRSHRNSTEPTYEVLVVGRAQRLCAHLLSLLPATLLSLLLTVARIGYLAGQPGAVGEVRPLELLAGPLCVLLAGVVGVLLSTFARSAAIAPMVLVGLGMLTFVGALNTGSEWRWLGLLAFENENAAPLPTVLVDRPAAAHLLWLVALTALLSAAAVLRAGGRGAALKAVAALALAGALAAGFTQTGGISPAAADKRVAFTEHPAAQQNCTTRNGITYCAFPGFEKWTEEWGKVTEGVLRYVPRDMARSGYAVRQRVFPAGGTSSDGVAPPLESWTHDDAAAGTPGAVTVGTDWSDGATGGDGRSDAVTGFAAEFAYRVVTGKVPDQPRLSMVCGARAVLVLWLAGEATPGTQDALRSMRDRTFGGGLSMPLLNSAAGFSFEPRAAAFAFDLIDHPAERSTAAITANWAELTAPGTSVDRAAELLGVKAPEAVAAADRVAGC
jgi:hypothetical protein